MSAKGQRITEKPICHEYLELLGMPEDPYMEASLQAPSFPDYVLGPEEPEQAPPSPDYVPGPEHADDEIVVELLLLPAADQAPSSEETEPFETDESAATSPPHPAYRVIARISIPTPVPTPVWSDAKIPSPPLPQIPSPPLPVSSPVPLLSSSPPASPIHPLGYRAAMIRLRAEAAYTSHSLPLPAPIILSHTIPAAPSSGTPPLHLLSTDHREDRPEVTLPPRKRLGIALGPAYEVRESSSAAATRPAGGLRADHGTPPLLPIPLPAPSTSRRADIPEADTPPRKRLLLTAPTPRVEVGESSAAAAARQPGSTMARRVDHSFVDTVDTRVRDTERRTMAAVEVVNLRVSYQADVRRRESLGFYSRHQEAQEDRAAVRAEIEILRRERLAYEQESIETRQALARSEAYSRALEARIRVLETQAYRHEWQRQDADDRAIEHIIRTQALEAGARVDTLEDTGVTAALAARDANTDGIDSHNSGIGARRNERATGECTYLDFMKCQPLNFKGTEGFV
ncbi:hypothetical protein Tco_0755918 [Tanacetum coccineum]